MRKSWEISIHAKGSGGFRFGLKAKLAQPRGNSSSRFPLLSRLYSFFVKPPTPSNPKFLHRLKPSSPSRSKHHHSKNPPPIPEPNVPLGPPNIKTAGGTNKVSRFTPRSRSLPSRRNPENDTLFVGAKPTTTTTTLDDESGLGSSIVRSVKSFSQSVEERSVSGILIHGWCVAMFAFLLLMERFGITKWRSLLAFLAAAIVAWGVALRVTRNVGSADQGSVGEAWKYAASSGSFDQLSHVIFTRIWQAIGL